MLTTLQNGPSLKFGQNHPQPSFVKIQLRTNINGCGGIPDGFGRGKLQVPGEILTVLGIVSGKIGKYGHAKFANGSNTVLGRTSMIYLGVLTQLWIYKGHILTLGLNITAILACSTVYVCVRSNSTDVLASADALRCGRSRWDCLLRGASLSGAWCKVRLRRRCRRGGR